MKKFWMIKGPAGGARFKHESRESAEGEAFRLAKMNPGETFYVLEAVAAHEKIEVHRVSFDGCDRRGFKEESDEVPF